MKIKSLLLLTALSAGIEANAQLNVWATDSIEMGANYANDVFYNLKNGNKKVQVANDWDLAFQMTAFGDSAFNATIRANHAKKKVEVYSVHVDSAGFDAYTAADTAGMLKPTMQQVNNEVSWGEGAFFQNRDASDLFDYGWGRYQGSPNHNLRGDSVYVVKVGAAAYKILVMDYTSIGPNIGYTFRIAALDGSSDNTVNIKRSTPTDFKTRLWAYYNIASNTVIDREPSKTDWDMLFTQYVKKGIFGPSGLQVYTGVLVNQNVMVAKVRKMGLDADTANYMNYMSLFTTKTNTIGDDWKVFDQPNMKYIVSDSTTYFIKTNDGAYHQLLFTRFDGAFPPFTGKVVFDKRKLTQPTGVKSQVRDIEAFVIVPNPSVNGKVNVMIDVKEAAQNARLVITDITGKVIENNAVILTTGLNALEVKTSGLVAGSYFVTITNGSWKVSDRLIVQ
ncbi:MAG: T9SS type A sorting domain-containing protein [Sphingobacteriales bacterium]|nr:MAG: T9SS type A sorting domain-containing protein [Sphingobacteriales bacterium]